MKMLDIQLNTLLLMTTVLMIVMLVNIFISMMTGKTLKTNSLLIYNFNKMIYNFKEAELNKMFFGKSLYLCLLFILSVLPIFYYSNNSSGYDLEYLLSSVNENDFLMIWIVINGLFYYPAKLIDGNSLKTEFGKFFTLLTYISVLFLILIKQEILIFQTSSTSLTLMTSLVLICLLIVTRTILLKPEIKKFENLALQQFYSLCYNLFQFSICMISAAFIQKALQIHLEELYARYLVILWATIIYAFSKIESVIWSKINNKQNFYLFQTYQLQIQFGIIIFICITSYYF